MENQETQNVENNQEQQEIKPPKKIKLIKIGGGSLRLGDKYNNKIIKPNQPFFVESIEDIPRLFRKFVKPVSPYDVQEKEAVVLPDITEYEIKPKGKGWYDVVNTKSGKAINTKALREEDAKRLLGELT